MKVRVALMVLLSTTLFAAKCVPEPDTPEPRPEPTTPEPPGPTPPPPEPDPDPPAPDEPTCAAACEKQRDLGCPISEDSPEGDPCEERCEASFRVGIPGYGWNLAALTAATTCEATK